MKMLQLQLIKKILAINFCLITTLVFADDIGDIVEHNGSSGITRTTGIVLQGDGGEDIFFKDSIETDYLTCTTDFIATVAHLFDDILPENIGEDSVSFLPVLLGEDKNDIDRGGIVHHSDAGFYAIRKGKWKLIFDENAGSRRVDPKDKPVINPGEIQLFNMQTDAIESTNVAAQNIDIVEDLKKLMAKFINEGRSTVGKSQKNDPTPKGWKNVSHFESYLKIN